MNVSSEASASLAGVEPAASTFDTGLAPQHWRRVPEPEESERWIEHAIGGRVYRFAQPLTFTPYAATQPCSARCRFCSENLRDGGTAPSLLRPGPRYFDQLQQALAQLHPVPLSYSLSGLETTDDPDWCLRLLDTLTQAERAGLRVDERVLYSNGAGLAGGQGDALLDALVAFGLSWIELSRHHPDAARNQALMRFRPGEDVADASAFAALTQKLVSRLPLRLVCLLQRGGVDDAEGVADYLHWARTLGADTVIFREFSRLDPRYRDNATRRYIDAERVDMATLLDACKRTPWWSSLTAESLTLGYYFDNLRLSDTDGMQVVFEASDYARMHARHASGAVYKLVFFPDGRLCAGWNPDEHVLWEAGDGQP